MEDTEVPSSGLPAAAVEAVPGLRSCVRWPHLRVAFHEAPLAVRPSGAAAVLRQVSGKGQVSLGPRLKAASLRVLPV